MLNMNVSNYNIDSLYSFSIALYKMHDKYFNLKTLQVRLHFAKEDNGETNNVVKKAHINRN